MRSGNSAVRDSNIGHTQPQVRTSNLLFSFRSAKCRSDFQICKEGISQFTLTSHGNWEQIF